MSHSFTVEDPNSEEQAFIEAARREFTTAGHTFNTPLQVHYAGGPLAGGGFAWIAHRAVLAICSTCGDFSLTYMDVNVGDPDGGAGCVWQHVDGNSVKPEHCLPCPGRPLTKEEEDYRSGLWTLGL